MIFKYVGFLVSDLFQKSEHSDTGGNVEYKDHFAS